MGLGGVAIATLPSVIFPKLMFSDRLGGNSVFCNIFNRKDNIVEFRKESCKGTLFEHHVSCFLSIYVCCVI